MKRLMSLLAIGLISANVGCTLCSSCDDYSYGAFGGLWERSDLTYGRVGSAFAPQGFSTLEGESVELVDPEGSDTEAPAGEEIAPPPVGEAPGSEGEAPGSEDPPGADSLLDT